MARQSVRSGDGGGVKTVRGVVLVFVATFALVGCGLNDDRLAFDGQFYRAKVRDLEARHLFTVTATPVSASLIGAREAARFEATRYCVNNYGSSAIRWVVGPDDPDEMLPIDNNTLTLQGACPL